MTSQQVVWPVHSQVLVERHNACGCLLKISNQESFPPRLFHFYLCMACAGPTGGTSRCAARPDLGHGLLPLLAHVHMCSPTTCKSLLTKAGPIE